MPYLGNNLEAAFKNYKSIDDISSSFNGSTTSFALQVNSLTPVPFPRDAQNCLISIGGVIQKPDATGSTGFKLSGTNIVFSSAPAIGESFFGVILAGADYVNAGVNYPDGTAGAPSITWSDDTDTGFYRSGAGTTSATANGSQVLEFPSSTSGTFSVLSKLAIGTTSATGKLTVHNSDDANVNVLEVFNDNGNNSGGFSQASAGDGTIFAKKNDGTLNIFLRSDGISYFKGGNVSIGTSAADTLLHLEATNTSVAVNNAIRISDADTAVVADQVCGRIEFETADTGNPGVNCQIDNIYSGNGGGSELQIRTGFAGSLVDALRIDDTGKVGIKVTPTTALHVKEAAQADVAIFECSHSSNWGSQISLKHSTSSAADDDMVGSVSFDGKDDAGNNTTYAQIRSYATDVSNNAEDGVITFHTRNHSAFGERMRLTNDGNLSLGDGNLVVANGHGVDFSAWTNTGGTGTGNKHEILQTYEQGTFTPRLKPNDSETGMVTGVGVYVRVGHIVHMRFSFSNKDTTSLPDGKTVAIDQLPFTCDMDGQSGYHTGTTVMMQRINTRPEATFYTNDNTSILYGIYASDGGAWAGWNTNDFNNHSSTYLNFSLSMLCD